jgi:23S rRNA pseudouridine955/2504/2580 synthase
MSVKKLIINNDNSGRRLDNYLISTYSSVPKSKIYNIIRKGEVRVNSSRVKPNYKIKTDDIIRIPPNLNIDQPLTKTIGIDLIKKHAGNILFENDNYIVINKKSGIAVHGGTKNIIGLIDIIREKYGKNIDLCHRLDKNTTGCLVFGKNKKAVKFFNNLLIDNNVKKTYQAVLKGKLKKNKVVNKPIYKNFATKSKNSISKFKIIEHLNDATLVEVQIYTGRSHQIRIHAALINHPIIFDNRYGDKDFNKSFDKNIRKKIALHSKSISFTNLDSKILNIESNPPNKFNDLVKMLK